MTRTTSGHGAPERSADAGSVQRCASESRAGLQIVAGAGRNGRGPLHWPGRRGRLGDGLPLATPNPPPPPPPPPPGVLLPARVPGPLQLLFKSGSLLLPMLYSRFRSCAPPPPSLSSSSSPRQSSSSSCSSCSCSCSCSCSAPPAPAPPALASHCLLPAPWAACHCASASLQLPGPPLPALKQTLRASVRPGHWQAC